MQDSTDTSDPTSHGAPASQGGGVETSRRESLRLQLAGLGERSARKTWYPQLQDHLRELERFRALLDQVQDAIFVFDPESLQVLDCNQAACILAGLSREELLSRRLDLLLQRQDAPTPACFLEAGAGLIPCLLHRAQGEPLAVEARCQQHDFEQQLHGVAVVRDASERLAAESRLQASLREKDLLLREVHHRVKNNLQVVSSFISLQAQQLVDPSGAMVLRETQNRIRAIATVHEQLYAAENLHTIDFCEYLDGLAVHLAQVYHVRERRVSLRISHCAMGLSIEKAIPCGLILNELITNAMRHAFPERGREACEEPGEVLVSFVPGDAGLALLTVADNGAGLPPALDWREAKTLGFTIVRLLVEQLRGRMQVVTRPLAPGTRVEIALPLTAAFHTGG